MFWLQNIVQLFALFACLSRFSVPADVEREGLRTSEEEPGVALPCPGCPCN